MSSTSILTTIIHVNCGACGLIFGLEEGFYNARRVDGKTFLCPNGCRRCYRDTGLMRAERAAKRAQELLDAERRRTEQLRADLTHAEHRRRAEAGAKTKLKKRAAAGVCPCCTRSFGNVARHIAQEHPAYVAEAKGEKIES